MAAKRKQTHTPIWMYSPEELNRLFDEGGRRYDEAREAEYEAWLKRKEDEENGLIPLTSTRTTTSTQTQTTISKAKEWQLKQIEKRKQEEAAAAAAATQQAEQDAADEARIKYYEGMDFHGGAGSGEQFTTLSMENYLIELITKSKSSKDKDKKKKQAVAIAMNVSGKGKKNKSTEKGSIEFDDIIAVEDTSVAANLPESKHKMEGINKSIVEELADSKFSSELDAEDKDREGVYTIIELVNTKSLKDACWEGYEAVGMKTKNGKQVPNCVPKKKKKK